MRRGEEEKTSVGTVVQVGVIINITIKGNIIIDDVKVRREYREVKLLGDMAGGKVEEDAEK